VGVDKYIGVNLVGTRIRTCFSRRRKIAVRSRTVSWLRAHPDYKLVRVPVIVRLLERACLLQGDDPSSETLAQWVKLTKDLDFDKYCTEMSHDKVWGDEVTMIAITEEFQVRIFLWSSTGARCVCVCVCR
jgi:hypothetical protein